MSVIEDLILEPERRRLKIKHQTPNCRHWFVRYGICTNCHTSVVDELKIQSFNYLLDGLQMSHEAVAATKRLTTRIISLNEKKLHLVLDLDHTLIHSIKVPNLSESEKYLIKESRNDIAKFEADSVHLLIKFRPFLHEFLQEANKLFTMYVYTMGGYDYAKIIQKLIDPEKIYFGDRVISSKESPFIKTLDLVLVDERGVLIVDDTRDVWPYHKSNLVEIERYNYFKGKKKSVNGVRSYSEEKRDESRENGGLMNVLKLLKEVYNGFFSCGDEELSSKDVRLLLEDCLSVVFEFEDV